MLKQQDKYKKKTYAIDCLIAFNKKKEKNTANNLENTVCTLKSINPVGC